MVTVGQFVLKVRKKYGYTQGDLAKILKYHKQMVSNIERGNYALPKPFCKRLMSHLSRDDQRELSRIMKVVAVKQFKKFYGEAS